MVLLLMSRRALENFFSQILNNSHENLFLLSGYYSSFSLTFYEMLEFIFDLLFFSLFYIYYTWCCLSFFSYSSYSFIEVSSAPSFFISFIYVILSSSTRFFSFLQLGFSTSSSSSSFFSSYYCMIVGSLFCFCVSLNHLLFIFCS